MPHSFQIQGQTVWTEGAGPQTLLMLHGWPDSHRLWDASVQALQADWRCVRLTLPGFDLGTPAQPTSLSDMCELLKAVVDQVSPDQPVTLLLHDWGCVFGYEFAARHPARVSRIVAVDIGDHNSAAFAAGLSGKARAQIFGYQFWLALSWLMGRHLSSALGTRMTRSMARAMRCPTPPDRIGWQQNYPYAMQWLGLAAGLGRAAKVDPACPVFYIYGQRKPFMFHSARWLEQLGQRAGSAVLGLPTGHWVMLQQPEAFHQAVREWLATPEVKTVTGSD